MIKEIPILFSTPMVKAILEGRKTQTRRLVKWPRVPDWHNWDYEPCQLEKPQGGGWWPWFYHRGYKGKKYIDLSGPLKCPYGQGGDHLWVKETHYAWGYWIQEGVTETGKPGWSFKDFTPEDQKGLYHYETNPPASTVEKRSAKKVGWYKRPAIFMPHHAARIWLEKEYTLVQKASEIDREDAIAEGMACITKDNGGTWKYGIPDLDGLPGTGNIGWAWQDWYTNPVEAFKSLWYKINGAETWHDWVWANSFKVLSTSGKPLPLTSKVNA
jgi:hypothetical protein